MGDWNKGYVTDLHYDPTYFLEQSPAILRLSCLMNAVETPPENGEFSYCDLGCGEGLTLLILAAANPHGRFVGVDFNPTHIIRARNLANAAALPNVAFLERSFEDLLDTSLPEFDFITLHGVYTWVSPAIRQAIIRFIRERLKPGGIVYIGYNSMPGWFTGLPVQRLLHDFGEQASGRSDEKIIKAVSMLGKLQEAGARTLKDNPFADRVVKARDQGSTRYLAHEYLNEHWHPMYHADVVQEMSAAKLTYVGSANLLTNFAQFMVTPAQQDLIDGLESATLKETVRDLCCGISFRQDVFMRGVRRMSANRQEGLLRQMRLVMMSARERFRMQLAVPAGDAELQSAYAIVADQLASGPRTVSELLDLPELRGKGGAFANELVGVLAGTAQALPLRELATIDPAPADRLNRILADGLEESPLNAPQSFAVPTLGLGITFVHVEALVFRHLLYGRTPGVDEMARELVQRFRDRGQRMLKDGAPVDSEDLALEIARNSVRAITSEAMPVWSTCWPHLQRASGLPA